MRTLLEKIRDVLEQPTAVTEKKCVIEYEMLREIVAALGALSQRSGTAERKFGCVTEELAKLQITTVKSMITCRDNSEAYKWIRSEMVIGSTPQIPLVLVPKNVKIEGLVYKGPLWLDGFIANNIRNKK